MTCHALRGIGSVAMQPWRPPWRPTAAPRPRLRRWPLPVALAPRVLRRAVPEKLRKALRSRGQELSSLD